MAYRVETFARKIGVTRQVLVNDDLGAFADLSRRMGQAAAGLEYAYLAGGEGPPQRPARAIFNTRLFAATSGRRWPFHPTADFKRGIFRISLANARSACQVS